MERWQIVTGVFTGLLALLLAVYVSFTARRKGPVFSNAYLWTSKKEREKIDKKAEYRLVTVVFGCLAAFFALETVYIFTLRALPLGIGFCILGFAAVYAVGKAAAQGKKKR